jgi:hypothetical protein
LQVSGRKKFLVPGILIIALAALLLGAYFNGVLSNAGKKLPPGCAKPAGGFLIIANEQGYNDSVGHGAPYSNWPVISVHQGQSITIVVCDTDTQAHGFQIDHYYDRSVQTIVPGQVITVSFVANETGSFRIYCDVFCTVHIFMQNGELIVTP